MGSMPKHGDGRGMAFSLVDRITEIEPGTRARGCFAIPGGLSNPSPCLVAEAVGQLAAWVAMAKAEFRSRPVAGIVGEVKLKEMAAPGTILDLKVDLESCEADSILYDG
jgi:3-hydroxymyristoyl/3-hydroxydecanoyl-(acyl carrier protein) dehydratase